MPIDLKIETNVLEPIYTMERNYGASSQFLKSGYTLEAAR